MDTSPLELPARPVPPPPAVVPVVGLIAPLVLAAVLYAVTGSPMALLFALLGPVLALGGIADGRLGGRRRRRRDLAARDAALQALEQALQARSAVRLLALQREHPSPAALAEDPSRWRVRPPRGDLVLGTADTAVPPEVRGDPADDRERALVALAAVVADAPLTAPAGTSVAVCGPALIAAAFARAVAVSRARALGRADPADVVADEHAAAHDVVVRIDSVTRAVVVHATGAAAGLEGVSFRPALITAASLAEVAPATVLARPDLGALAAQAPPGALTAVFAVGDDGRPVAVDLGVAPHAVVAGTTGSGKSALLTAWLVALATTHSPADLAFLLVDCKGGAAFDPLSVLPHVAGLVTDLDPAGTERAVAGLAAELRRRERVLREAGVADARDASLARLVVVVDEYRALVERAPQLAAVFADVAARGRSLGVHLVLCTQRATGTIRDELLANCGLRVALRMRDASDSAALLGRPDAAALPVEPGVAVIQADGDAVRVRVADTARPGALRAAVAKWHGVTCAVPWCPPLPARLPVGSLPAGDGVVLGLVDLPEEQRQPPLTWRPDRAPSLAIVGLPGSGRSTALDLAAAGLGVAILPDDPAELWDALAAARPLVVDDLESLLDRLPAAHAAEAVERLATRLRGRVAPTVAALREPAAWAAHGLRGAAQLFESRLLLALSADDRLTLGGRRGLTLPPLPGRGEWQGAAAQVALPAVLRPRSAPVPVPLFDAGDATWLLLTPEADRRSAQLRAAGVPLAATPGTPGVWVAASAAWQAEWGALARLQAAVPVLADRVPPADARTLLSASDLLPPVSGADDVVLLAPGSAPRRVRLPAPHRLATAVRAAPRAQ